MARKAFKQTLDFNDVPTKRKFQGYVGTLAGKWRVSLEPAGNKWSNPANAYYHVAVVAPFYDYLRDQDAEIVNTDQAHDLIKEKLLRVEVFNHATGEPIGYRTRSTTELTVEEFYDFVERARAWLLDMFGIVTLDPEQRYAEATR